MPDVKEFKSADYERRPSIPFILEGEEFLLPGELPGSFLLRIGEVLAGGEGGQVIAGAAMLDLFREAMEPDEWQRFRTFVAAHPHDIHARVLGAIISWWYQEMSGRPTVPSSSSQPGRRATKAGSTDDSPSPDSTSTT